MNFTSGTTLFQCFFMHACDIDCSVPPTGTDLLSSQVYDTVYEFLRNKNMIRTSNVLQNKIQVRTTIP